LPIVPAPITPIVLMSMIASDFGGGEVQRR